MTETSVAADGRLGRELVARMEQITLDRIGHDGLANAHRNMQYLDRGQSLRALRGAAIGEGDHALIICAGPSLHRRPVAEELKSRGYRGAIIITDSCLSWCLRNEIVPDLVVTLDPHATRIVRWFGDPQLVAAHLGADDYHSRQDMDPAFSRDELAANQQMLELLDQYGPQIRIALSTSASEAVVDRVLSTGMKIYWWNPMYDDPAAQGSITRQLQRMNGLPAMNAGGNVGTACWMMAHAVLQKTCVAVVGMDFSYYAETPYRNTQYYNDALALVGEQGLDSIFIRVFNPYLNTMFYTDPAYMWYRECFLEMAAEADCVTYNCTEGGILFGDPVQFTPLSAFLDETARR